MLASIILAGILLVILGFYALVRVQVAACEAGPYQEPLTSAEEWSASLDVALGLDYFSTTTEEQVDHMWDMLPILATCTYTTPPAPVKVARPSYTMRTLREMCYV